MANSAWIGFETLPAPLRFRSPSHVIIARTLDHVLPSLARVEHLCSDGRFHAVGCISYEASPAFDSAATVVACPEIAFPLVWFGLYDNSNVERGPLVDDSTGLHVHEAGYWASDVTREAYDTAVERIRAGIYDGSFYQVNYTVRMHASFRGSERALLSDLLKAQRCGFGAFIDIAVDTGSHFQVLSASPELFFHWRRSANQISCRPMKGTRRRGVSCSADLALRRELLDSEKDRAENVMIVDLVRNDLSRVAVTGSVAVQDLFHIEAFPTVLQMTTTVTAATRAGATLTDVLRALFPCGSITGAPKFSAMKAISSLECAPRGPYCGAIIYIAAGEQGNITASVPIRTVLLDRSADSSRGDEQAAAQYGVGGGITFDSTASGEYDEVLAKAAILNVSQSADHPAMQVAGGSPRAAAHFDPTHLLETMRLRSDGSFAYLQLHLRRLRASCAYFGFDFDGTRVQEVLNGEALRAKGAVHDKRLRLQVSRSRCAEAEVSEIVCTASTISDTHLPLVVVYSDSRVSAGSVSLYHKSTDRQLYTWARERCGCDDPGRLDAVLVNSSGFVTEGCIGNIVVEMSLPQLQSTRDDTDGLWDADASCEVDAADIASEGLWPTPAQGCAYFTPPVASGLLPGVLRARILALHHGNVHTRQIRAEELLDSSICLRVWLVNSVRGWVQVRPVTFA